MKLLKSMMLKLRAKQIQTILLVFALALTIILCLRISCGLTIKPFGYYIEIGTQPAQIKTKDVEVNK